MSLNRRQAVSLLGASGLVACAPKGKDATKADALINRSSVFAHGVASGDPDPTSIVLWTRVTTQNPSETVSWVVAKDPELTQIVAEGSVTATQDTDHTVKVIAEGLVPGETYYYQFSIGAEESILGRTKTLPEGALDKLGIALASCSNYAFGYFNAYGAIARDEAIDFVLHTGDYIYEYGADEWGGETAKTIGRVHNPPHEIISLTDYRMRHAQYKTDTGSIAMHAMHPIVCCWDDHESANNPWMGGAQNHQPETEGDWVARREASLRAYYEWMPIREPQDGLTRAEFWRTYRFGDLATLITLETRHTGRGQQVDYSPWFDKIKSREDRDAFMTEVMDDPSRRMISTKMEKALVEGLSASVKSGQPWRIIGNASPIARMLVPDVAALGIDPSKKSGADVPGTGADMFWKGKWNLPFYTDTWDGYPAAREAFYELAKASGADDLVFLTGDSHSFWANQLSTAAGEPMGIELGTAGISSPGDFVESGWDEETAQQLDTLFAEQLDEVLWTDNMHQGYVRTVFSREEIKADFIAVETVLMPDDRTKTLRSETISHDDHGALIYRDA